MLVILIRNSDDCSGYISWYIMYEMDEDLVIRANISVTMQDLRYI